VAIRLVDRLTVGNPYQVGKGGDPSGGYITFVFNA
jgi:hypothetical protein